MNGRSPDVRNAEGVISTGKRFAIALLAGSPHPPNLLLPRCGRRGSKIDANRHDGQSFFAIAPSAGSPSGNNPTRNFGNLTPGPHMR